MKPSASHGRLLRNLCVSPVGLAVANKEQVFAHEILGSPFDPTAQLTKNVLSVKTLLSPLSREQIKLARCLGLNYADHAVRDPRDVPVIGHVWLTSSC